MKKTVVFFLSVLLLSACGKKKDSFKLGESHRTELDESKIVFNSIPKSLILVNDSNAVMVCNRQYVSLINVYTGKCLQAFSVRNIRIDSLLDVTYNKYYNGKRIYLSDSLTAEGLEGATLFMTNMFFDNELYYVYMNGEVEVKYINDSVSLGKNLADPKVKEVLKKSPETNFHFMEYVEFMCVLDDNLKLKKIIPLYPSASLGGKYSATYQLGFGVNEGNFYVSLLPSFWGVSYRSKVNDNGSFYSMAKQLINKTDSAQLIFSNAEMDYSDFSFADYLNAHRIFHALGNTNFFCNGKEIRTLNGDKPLMKANAIEPNEWIEDFYIDDEFIFLKTITQFPKKNPSKLDIAYGIDSVGAQNVIAFDRHSRTKQAFPLSLKEAGSFAIVKDKLIFIERDKEHYYVTRVPIEEN